MEVKVFIILKYQCIFHEIGLENTGHAVLNGFKEPG